MGIHERSLEPPEPKLYGYCAHCDGEVYTDTYMYNHSLLCSRCFAYSSSNEATADFIASYPDEFMDYLRQVCVVSGYEPGLLMLEDYKEWSKERFDEWLLS